MTFGVTLVTDFRSLEIVDENAVGMPDLALHLQARRSVLTLTFAVVKLDRDLGGDECDVGELQQEIALPASAIVLAVRYDLEAEVLLHLDDIADGGFLDRCQIGRRHLLVLDGLARRDQIFGPNETPTW